MNENTSRTNVKAESGAISVARRVRGSNSKMAAPPVLVPPPKIKTPPLEVLASPSLRRTPRAFVGATVEKIPLKAPTRSIGIEAETFNVTCAGGGLACGLGVGITVAEIAPVPAILSARPRHTTLNDAAFEYASAGTSIASTSILDGSAN